MDLFKGAGQGKSVDQGSEGSLLSDRYLSMLLEGAVLNMPEVDSDGYREFRTNLNRLAMQLSEPMGEEERLTLMRMILHEFSNYRAIAEKAQRERLVAWRAMTQRLVQDLLDAKRLDARLPNMSLVLSEIPKLATASDIHEYQTLLTATLKPQSASAMAVLSAIEVLPDQSVGNDNAVGLPGSGAAVEHLRQIMDKRGTGFIALLRLGCLDVLQQRFGPDAVQDALMAVSNYLTESLHSDDSIYHWSESALLAILQGRATEQILAAELQRIVMANRETTLNIGGRNVMVRIPVSFDLIAVEQFRNPEELYRIQWLKNNIR